MTEIEYEFNGTPEYFLSVTRACRDESGQIYFLEHNIGDKNYKAISLYSRRRPGWQVRDYGGKLISQDGGFQPITEYRFTALLQPDSNKSKIKGTLINGEWAKIEPQVKRLIEYLERNGLIEQKHTALIEQPPATKSISAAQNKMLCHESARQRLRAGETLEKVRADWREEYFQEKGVYPNDKKSGENMLWYKNVMSQL